MYFKNAKRTIHIAEKPNMPLYDSENGKSTYAKNSSQGDEAYIKDIELMKALYSELNSLIQGFVEQTLDEYEYINSPIYDESGIDKETLAQLVDKVIKNASDVNDDIGEITLEAMEYDIYQRDNMLNSIVESLVLTDIFAVRRPRYRRLRANYIYSDGVYDGVAAR